MKKIIASIFVLLVLLSFVCCSDTQNSTNNTTDNSFSESIDESTASVESLETTVSVGDSEISDMSSSPPERESNDSVSNESEVLESSSFSAPNEDDDENNSSTKTEEPEVSENPQVNNPKESEVEQTSEPNIEPEINEPVVSEPEVSEETSNEAEPEPFDIDYWIEYARNYAISVGLTLDETAVDCWDNPIGAGSHCIYLERDIKDGLNFYAKDEAITCVWIWAEKVRDNYYNLYIGYA